MGQTTHLSNSLVVGITREDYTQRLSRRNNVEVAVLGSSPTVKEGSEARIKPSFTVRILPWGLHIQRPRSGIHASHAGLIDHPNSQIVIDVYLTGETNVVSEF